MADPAASQAASPVFARHALETPSGRHRFETSIYQNENGEREMVVIHREYPSIPEFLAKSFRVPVIYARDLDANGTWDLWFVLTSEGTVERIDRVSQEKDGWDVASDLLLNTIHIQNRNPFREGVLAVLNALTIGAPEAKKFFAKILRGEMNLHDLEARADRLRERDLHAARVADTYSYLSRSWTALSVRIMQEFYVKQSIFAVETIALSLIGGEATSVAGAEYKAAVQPWILKFTKNELIEKTTQFIAKQVASRAAAIVAQKLFDRTLNVPLNNQLTKYLSEEYGVGGISAKKRLQATLIGMIARDQLSHAAAPALLRLNFESSLKDAELKNLLALSAEGPSLSYSDASLTIGYRAEIFERTLLHLNSLPEFKGAELLAVIEIRDNAPPRIVTRNSKVVLPVPGNWARLKFYEEFGVWPKPRYSNFRGYAVTLLQRSARSKDYALHPLEIRYLPLAARAALPEDIAEYRGSENADDLPEFSGL